MSQQVMESWTVYHRHPGMAEPYVAVKFLLYAEPIPTSEILTSSTLGGIRDRIPQGLVCFNRSPSDDPSIVETWF